MGRSGPLWRGNGRLKPGLQLPGGPFEEYLSFSSIFYWRDSVFGVESWPSSESITVDVSIGYDAVAMSGDGVFH